MVRTNVYNYAMVPRKLDCRRIVFKKETFLRFTPQHSAAAVIAEEISSSYADKIAGEKLGKKLSTILSHRRTSKKKDVDGETKELLKQESS